MHYEEIAKAYIDAYYYANRNADIAPFKFDGYRNGYFYFKHGPDLIKYRRKQVIENTANLKAMGNY